MWQHRLPRSIRQLGLLRQRVHSTRRSQVLVLFGLGLPAILLMAGLGLDMGNYYLQRRIAQNAADAAALGGARCLYLQASIGSNTCRPVDSTYAPVYIPLGQDALDAMQYWAAKNSQGPTTSVVTADWVTYSGTTWGTTAMTSSNSQASTSPSTATGVSVTTQRSFPPILLGVAFDLLKLALPATISSGGNFIVQASAKSQVLSPIVPAAMAPVAGCGPMMFEQLNGTTFNIFVGGTPPTIDYATDGNGSYDFILQSSQLWKNEVNPPCPQGSGNAPWKGTISPGGNITLPSDQPVASGNSVAPLGATCTGSGQPDPSAFGYGGTTYCYLLIPITDGNNPPLDAHVVAFACMQIDAGPGPGTVKWSGQMAPSSDPCLPFYAFSPGAWTKASGVSSLTRIGITQ